MGLQDSIIFQSIRWEDAVFQQNNRPYLQLFTLVIFIPALIFIPAILDHLLVQLWPSLEDFTPLPLLGAYCVIFLIAYQLMPYLEPTPKQQIARLTRRLEQSPTDRYLLQQRAQAYLQRMFLKVTLIRGWRLSKRPNNWSPITPPITTAISY
jgi:hypothetical protein